MTSSIYLKSDVLKLWKASSCPGHELRGGKGGGLLWRLATSMSGSVEVSIRETKTRRHHHGSQEGSTAGSGGPLPPWLHVNLNYGTWCLPLQAHSFFRVTPSMWPIFESLMRQCNATPACNWESTQRARMWHRCLSPERRASLRAPLHVYCTVLRRALGTGELGWCFFCCRAQPGFETQELERDALRCML